MDSDVFPKLDFVHWNDESRSHFLAMVLEGLAAVRPGLFPLLSLLELEESNLPGCTLL